MTTARPRPLLLLLLLLAATTALPVTTDTQALQCLEVHDVTKDSPAIFLLDEQSTRSIRFSLSTEIAWDVLFTFGEGSAENFIPRIDLEMRKLNPKANLAILKVSVKGAKKTMLLHTRVDSSWLEGDGQVTLFLGESTLSIAFSNGNSKFLQQLSNPELAELSAVKVRGQLQVEECEGPGRIPDTTTITTAEPTTTTTTTFEPTTTTSVAVDTTTAVTTTPEPTTVTPVADTSAPTPEPTTTASVASTSTLSPVTEESTAATPDDADNATTSDDELCPPCVPADNAVTDSVAVTACSTPSSNSVKEAEASVQCVDVPRWAWACAGLSVVFFLFIVVLIIYSITLYRRSWKLGKVSGSYGMSAQDMHYYEMRNNNLMIGNTVPRIVTPRPFSTPGLSPSPSVNRLSSKSLSPSRSSTPFPPPPQSPDLENSIITSTDRREKSRSSKVSFAEE